MSTPLKISNQISHLLKSSSNCKALIISDRSHDLFELALEVKFSHVDYHFIKDEKSKIKPVNEFYDLVYLDIELPELLLQVLGPVIKVLKDNGILAGAQEKLFLTNQINNPIRALADRFGLNLQIQDDASGWLLMKQPINISFIVPAFNCAQTVEETIYSIIDDNIEEGDEIIIVDDGSTDNTRDVLERLQNIHPIIRLIHHSRNKGGASARNTAVDNATNPLIFCLDSDNVLIKGTVKKLKAFLIEQNADIAAFERLYFFKTVKSEITHEWIFRSGLITLADALSSEITPISSGNYLYSKSSWYEANGYPLFSRALDAWGFGLRQLGTGHKMVVLENSGYFHRYGHTSYWVREQSGGDTSKLAFQLLSPFINLLDEESILYLLNQQSRNSWFENLRSRPLRLLGQPHGKGGVAIDSMGSEINSPQSNTTHRSNNLFQKLKSYFGI